MFNSSAVTYNTQCSPHQKKSFWNQQPLLDTSSVILPSQVLETNVYTCFLHFLSPSHSLIHDWFFFTVSLPCQPHRNCSWCYQFAKSQPFFSFFNIHIFNMNIHVMFYFLKFTFLLPTVIAFSPDALSTTLLFFCILYLCPLLKFLQDFSRLFLVHYPFNPL